MKYQFTVIFDTKEEMDTVIARLESKPKSQAKLPDESKETFYCNDCGTKIPEYVANFCIVNKDKFIEPGKVYCMNCQPKHKVVEQ